MRTMTDADFREAIRTFYRETAASRGEIKEIVDEVIDEITEETAAQVYGGQN